MTMNGSTVLLDINIGTTEDPDYVVIPCQTSFSLAMSTDTIDTSCKDTNAATNIPGRLSTTISAEYRPDDFPEVVVSPTTAQAALFKAVSTGQQVGGQVEVAGSGVHDFVATITDFTVDAPDQDVVSISVEFAVSGPLVPSA